MGLRTTQCNLIPMQVRSSENLRRSSFCSCHYEIQTKIPIQKGKPQPRTTRRGPASGLRARSTWASPEVCTWPVQPLALEDQTSAVWSPWVRTIVKSVEAAFQFCPSRRTALSPEMREASEGGGAGAGVFQDVKKLPLSPSLASLFSDASPGGPNIPGADL